MRLYDHHSPLPFSPAVTWRSACTQLYDHQQQERRSPISGHGDAPDAVWEARQCVRASTRRKKFKKLPTRDATQGAVSGGGVRRREHLSDLENSQNPFRFGDRRIGPVEVSSLQATICEKRARLVARFIHTNSFSGESLASRAHSEMRAQVGDESISFLPGATTVNVGRLD